MKLQVSPFVFWMRMSTKLTSQDGTDLIRPICDRMGDKPDDAGIVSASKVLDAAIAAQATTDASSTSTNAAGNVGYNTIKVLAAGAVAALVI